MLIVLTFRRCKYKFFAYIFISTGLLIQDFYINLQIGFNNYVIMKRFAIFIMLLMGAFTAYAQHNGFVCTGNNVNVRTGPGKNYPVYDYNKETGYKRQIFKGDVVADEGKRKNGFCLISGPLEWGGDERDGWVSAQFLKPVTICPECGGTKNVNVAEVDISLETCKKCKGKGYLPDLKK